MWEWLVRVFGEGFMPHGHCYLWSPSMVWLQVLSNFLIGAAYLSISATLYYIIRRIRDVPFSWMYIAFGIFIVTCGMTHFSEVVTVWHPIYWIDGGLRVVTAIASLGTAFLLIPLVPKAIALADAAHESHARGLELENAYLDLANAHRHARELEAAKGAFFANVSHDLRTPLALILGPIERLLASSELSRETREELEVADRNARTLLKNVNDLLDVSRIEAGRMTPTWGRADLSALVRQTAALFEGSARSRRFALDVDAPASVDAEVDPDMIQRVVANLLSNAARFVPEGGHVRVGVAAEGNDATIVIADDGPGIADEEKAKVFERFRQAEGTDRRRLGGSGLGLSIAKELVELHEGRITLSDARGGGACFSIRLPRRAPEGATVRDSATPAPLLLEPVLLEGDLAIPRAQPPRDVTSDATVLVVEDHPDMRRHIERVLSRSFVVTTAADGQQARELLRTLRPVLIVTDLMMPGMTGAELVSVVRGDPVLSDTPVLVLSARADEKTRVEVLAAGADDYVIKPFAAEELLTRASNLATTSRARAALRSELTVARGDVDVLARGLAARKRELEGALERAEAGARAKDAFLSLVSHEVRTPIAAVQVQLELLRRVEKGRLGPRFEDAHGRMRRALDRLSRLLEDVLEYANLLGGGAQLSLEDVDVAEVVDEAIASLRQGIDEKRLVIEREVEPNLPPLRTDPRLLRVAVHNIVSNAVQHTSEGRIRVRLGRDDAGTRLEIHDSGPGIPADQVARIFLPFEMVEELRHKHLPGIGLGLALVRLVHDRLRGNVELRSAPGEGTTIVSVLPSLTVAT